MKRLTLFFLLAIVSPSWAATITAVAGGGNWSNTATWVGAATPTVADDVLLAITSGSVTVDVGTALAKSVTATAFINNLNFAAGQTLRVAGNVQFDTIVSGMTVNGSGALTISAASNMLSAGQTVTGSLGFGTGTKTLADSWNVNGDLICTAGGLSVNGNSINVKGSLSGNYQGTTNINLTGSGTWAGLNGGAGDAIVATTNNININTSGAITLGEIAYGGSGIVSYTSGTIVNTGSNLYLTTSCGVSTGTMHWGNIYIPSRIQVAVTLLAPLVADGTLGWAGVTVTAAGQSQTITGAFNTTVGGLEIAPGNSVKFTAGVTVTVSSYMMTGASPTGNLSWSGGTQVFNNPKIISLTASSPVFLNYTGGASGNLLFNCDMTDVTALGSAPLTIWTEGKGNTLLRTSNVATASFSPASGSSKKGFY